MITNTGKEIIGKYMLGQAPAYASYIALGCGTQPRPNINTVSNASSATTSGVTTVTVTSTDGLWLGAKVSKASGTGTLVDNTLVTSIISGNQFTISPSPTVELSSAVLNIETNPKKENLDFEMFRVPISSKGFVNDGGTEKLVLTAELPTEERYEITEVGIYSAGSNPSAGAYDSKTILAFTQGENWQYHTNVAAVSIPTITEPLDNGDNIISTTNKVFQTNADNSTFYESPRPERYERCRFLNNIILIRGDDSNIAIDSSTGSANGHFDVTSGNHIHLTGADVNFTRNSPKDELRLAFALISKDGDSSATPETIRVLVTFAETDLEDTGEFASFEAELVDSSVSGGDYDFSANRYFVVTKKLEDLYQSPNFTWNAVTVIKIYASIINTLSITNKEATTSYVTLTTSASHNLVAGDTVTVSGIDSRCNGTFTVYDTPSATTFRYASAGTVLSSTAVSPAVAIQAALSTYYVGLDAMRLENTQTINPLYGMTGYSVVQNADAETIVKSPNTSNYVEFRFSIEVT